MIPAQVLLRSGRARDRSFRFRVVEDELFTPLLAYVSLVSILLGHERAFGAGTLRVDARLALAGGREVRVSDVVASDQPAQQAAAVLAGPLALLVANDFERVFDAAMDEADRVDRPYMVYLGCGDNKYVEGARRLPAMLLAPGIELPATDATVLDRRAAELRLAYVARQKVTRPADWLMREADAAMGITLFWPFGKPGLFGQVLQAELPLQPNSFYPLSQFFFGDHSLKSGCLDSPSESGKVIWADIR